MKKETALLVLFLLLATIAMSVILVLTGSVVYQGDPIVIQDLDCDQYLLVETDDTVSAEFKSSKLFFILVNEIPIIFEEISKGIEADWHHFKAQNIPGGKWEVYGDPVIDIFGADKVRVKYPTDYKVWVWIFFLSFAWVIFFTVWIIWEIVEAIVNRKGTKDD